MEAEVPGPPASGRRFAEDPGSSGNGALPLNPEYDSEGVQPWKRRRKDRSSGGLGDNRSLYSAAPQPASCLSDLGLALCREREKESE